MPAKKRHPNARPGNANAAKPSALKRVVLPAQRVRPETRDWLEARPEGIGKALDHAVLCAQLVAQQFAAVGIRDHRSPL